MRSKLDEAAALLAFPGATLAPVRARDGFGVFIAGDRRRRPRVVLTRAEAEALTGVSARFDQTGAIARLADIAGARGAAWFGGRRIDAALRLWRDWARPGDPPPPALAGASGLMLLVLTAFRRGAGDFAAREAAWRWPTGAGAVALKLALDEAAQRYGVTERAEGPG